MIWFKEIFASVECRQHQWIILSRENENAVIRIKHSTLVPRAFLRQTAVTTRVMTMDRATMVTATKTLSWAKFSFLECLACRTWFLLETTSGWELVLPAIFLSFFFPFCLWLFLKIFVFRFPVYLHEPREFTRIVVVFSLFLRTL